MLNFSILSSILVLIFYAFNKYDKHSKDILMLISLFTICIIWSIYLLIDNERISFLIQIVILCILILCFYYIISINIEKNPKLIYAKQENYWNIDKENVINSFKYRSIEKNDRIEVNATSDSLYIQEHETQSISPNAISYFKKLNSIYKPTIIKNVSEIKNHKIHNKIFEKISSNLEKDKELFLDYEDILSKFENNLELFIIYIWDKYSKDFNIGIGQLETLAKKNPIAIELINAIDNTNLKMLKLKGSFLQYKYEKSLEEKGLNNGK